MIYLGTPQCAVLVGRGMLRYQSAKVGVLFSLKCVAEKNETMKKKQSIMKAYKQKFTQTVLRGLPLHFFNMLASTTEVYLKLWKGSKKLFRPKRNNNKKDKTTVLEMDEIID